MGKTHDEDGKIKDPFEILQSLGDELSPKSIETLGDMIAKKHEKFPH
jgi:hypothetical protein